MSTPSDIPVAPAGAAALLRRGVLLPARGEAAASLGCFLTRGLGLDPAYLEERVQTLLRNGLAVDDFAAPLAHGDRLALSAAMPGVADAPASSPCAQIDAQFGGRWEAGPDDEGGRANAASVSEDGEGE